MGVPELQTGCSFVNGSLPGLAPRAMGWEEDMEELLWGALVGLEHASSKGREVDLWVDFPELKRHV